LDRIYQGKKVKSILMDFSSESSYSIVLDQVRFFNVIRQSHSHNPS